MGWTTIPAADGQIVKEDWYTELRAAINERLYALLDTELSATQGDGADEMCHDDTFDAYKAAIDTNNLYGQFYQKVGEGPADVSFVALLKGDVMEAVFGEGVRDWPDRDSMAKILMFNDMRSVLNYLGPPFWVKAPESTKTDSIGPAVPRQFEDIRANWQNSKDDYFDWPITNNDPGWTMPDAGWPYWTGEAGEAFGTALNAKIRLGLVFRAPPRNNANIACEFYGQTVFVEDAGFLFSVIRTYEDVIHPTEGHWVIWTKVPELILSLEGAPVKTQTFAEGVNLENVWWEADTSVGAKTIVNVKIHTNDWLADPGLPLPEVNKNYSWNHMVQWGGGTPYFQIRWDYRA